jgi:hypothetical protein
LQIAYGGYWVRSDGNAVLKPGSTTVNDRNMSSIDSLWDDVSQDLDPDIDLMQMQYRFRWIGDSDDSLSAYDL